MSDIYAERQVAQAEREGYRQLARAVVAMSNGFIRVEPHANVMPCEDGAFVEAQIWVPKEALVVK